MGAHESSLLDAFVVVWTTCGDPPVCFPCTRPYIPDYLSDIISMSEETKLKKKSSSRSTTDGSKHRSGCFHITKRNFCLSTLPEVSESEEDSDDDRYRPTRPGDFEGGKDLSDDGNYRPTGSDDVIRPTDIIINLVDTNDADDNKKTAPSHSITDVSGVPHPLTRTTPPPARTTPPPAHMDSDRSLEKQYQDSPHLHVRNERKAHKHGSHKDRRRKASDEEVRTGSDRSLDSGKARSERKRSRKGTRSDSDRSLDPSPNQSKSHTDSEGKSGHKHWFSRRHSKNK